MNRTMRIHEEVFTQTGEESLSRVSISLHEGTVILTMAAADYGLPRRRSMSWQPIVVGVDASPEAAGAAGFACRMARVAGTSCHLVHGAPDLWASVGVDEGVGELRGVSLDAVRAHLTATLEDVVPRDLVDTMTVRLGPAAVVLKQAATDLGAELVVLGGKHHSAWGRWLAGSTSLNVARTTDVPVLVTAGPPPGIRRGLVAGGQFRARGPRLHPAVRYLRRCCGT